MQKIIIAAVSKNGVIGKAGLVPWYSAEELKHFKETTIGFPIIMGRKTFESLKESLKSRQNIVISTRMNPAEDKDDIKIFDNLDLAFFYCRDELNAEKVFIIGGGEIFDQAIKYADEMIISEMNFEADGDVYFPEIDYEVWQEESVTNYKDFSVIVYKRKNDSDIPGIHGLKSTLSI
jgi:dihydrofolate reductase